MDLSYIVNHYKTYLYELYLLDTNNQYQPIPILVANYYNGNSFPNTGTDYTKFQFTKRFYIVDNLSTKEGDFKSNDAPSYIRYPKSISFDIRLHKVSDERIYLPTIKIEYGTKTLTDGELDNPSTELTFSVQHNF